MRPQGLPNHFCSGQLQRRGRREAAAGGNVTLEDQVEARRRTTRSSHERSHATHEAGSSHALVRTRVKRLEAHRNGVEAHTDQPDLVGPVCGGDTHEGGIERRRNHMSALVVGVVAGNLRATRRHHLEEPATSRPKLLIEQGYYSLNTRSKSLVSAHVLTFPPRRPRRIPVIHK